MSTTPPQPTVIPPQPPTFTPTPPPTVIALRSRALRASHLCFEVDGIIGELKAQLGSQVTPFGFTAFYDNLGLTVQGAILGPVHSFADPSRLVFNSQGIQNDPTVQASTLVALRAESRKAVLDKAVNARQNAYYAKYSNVPGIINLMQTFYSDSLPGSLPGTTVANPASKPAQLRALQNIAQAQATALASNYNADGKAGVVKQTFSAIQANTASDIKTTNETITVSSDTIHSTEATGKAADNVTTQRILNTDYGYRMPLLEANAQNSRAQISLMDEIFAQFMRGQNLLNLNTVFQNELASIDLDVKRLQVAYLNTILMSPIAGIVTGIYKNLGDCVKAGEPVIRVEDNTTVILVGTLKYRGLISIGSAVTVQTNLFDCPSTTTNTPFGIITTPTITTITGAVIAARGHRNEDEQWDVLVSCVNIDASGKPILPLDYHFDYDNTTIAFN